MERASIDTTTALKVLLVVFAVLAGLYLLGRALAFVGSLVWSLVGVVLLIVLVLLAVRVLKDLL